ncbi:MAG TPA: cohesin domain-containing protein, partial [Bacteroidales bacterium]|nr:cohesin domain-containing protein [Bacteroidales bacterium]
CGGWSDIQEVDRSGAIINSGSTGLSGMYGSAYDPWTAGGPYLWIFDQGGNGVDIQQYSIANGALTGVMHDASDIPGFVSGNSAGGLCISNTAVPGKIALIGDIQNDPQLIFAYDLGEATAPWVTRTPNSGTIAPGSTQDVTVHFDATDLTEGTYTASLTFTSDPNVGVVNVPITLTVSSGPVPTVTIANVTAMPGPVSVPVHAANIVNMGSFQFSIEYDPALLTYTGTSNWFAGIDAVTVGNPSPGHLTFVWAAEMEGINIPDGNFFNIDFTWTGTTGQTSPLVWSDDPTPREFGDYEGVIFTPVYVNGSVTGGGIVPTVTIPNPVIHVPGPFAVPVHAANIENMGSFQFTIEYDPSLMIFDSVINWYPGITAVTVGNPAPGHITFVWAADLQGIYIPDGNFFDIYFNWTAADVIIITPVIWSNDPTPQEFADYDGNIFVPVYVNGSVTYDPVGIPEIGIASNSVFPNPATDVVNIKVSNDIRTVQVMNNLGMVISSATVAQEKIVNLNTSNYSAGTYFVRFISENGKTTVKKLVIIK